MKKITIIFVLLIILLWTVSFYFIPEFYGEINSSGEFGDMFGAINALFSGLAFVGVIIAIILQKDELALQRIELKQTREEMKAQRVQMEEQTKSLIKQRFEETFFQLMRLYNDTVNSLDLETKKEGNIFRAAIERQPRETEIKIHTGRDCFPIYYSFLNKEIRLNIENKLQNDLTFTSDEIIKQSYESFYDKYQSDLAHYFRVIYNILKFVDQANIENKGFYSNILRALMSSHELLLLKYNSESIYGKNKLKPFLIKFKILKHIPEKEIIEDRIATVIEKKTNEFNEKRKSDKW